MIQIFDANAVLRQDLNRNDGAAGMSPRILYERINADPNPQLWVWDGPRHNDRRRAVFPGYKLRDYTGQENVFAGLDVYRDLLALSKAIQITVPDYEADDVCYTLARRYAGQQVPVTVHTNDFDFHQLVGTPFLTVRGARGPVDQVHPRHVSTYKALRGDPSDKIPGLPGFGPKAWESFRELYDDVDEILRTKDYERLCRLPFTPKCAAWVRENAELLFTYYDITKMIEVPMELIDEHTHVGTPNPTAAMQLFSRFML